MTQAPLKIRRTEWSVKRTSDRQQREGSPAFIIHAGGDTPDEVKEAFADACDKMGWNR